MVGLVILIGVVAIGAVTILVIGGGQTTDLKDQATGEQAEATMGQLRSEVGALLQGTADRASAGFPSTDHQSVSVEDGSRIEVVVRGLIDDTPSECTFSSSLGSLRYDTGNAVLGYEGNGVFRRQDGNSVVVQTPNVAYRTVEIDGRKVHTLDVPAVDVTTDRSVGGDDVTVVERPGSKASLCAGETPLDHVDNATIRIENSDFYQGWYDYFQEEFGHATAYPGNQTAVVRNVHLGQIPPGPEQSFGNLSRTGNLLDPYSNSSYTFRTVHEINWEVGTGSRTIKTVRIDYENDSGIDLSHVEKEDLRVYYGSSINLDVEDSSHNRTDEIEAVRIEDNGTTLVFEFEEDLAGNGGGTGANAWFLAQYRNVRNPRWGGNYSVDIYINSESPARVGDLKVTGPPKPRPDGDDDGVPDGVDECPDTEGATGRNGCRALSVVGDDDALLVNQSRGEFVVLGSEFAVRNVTSRADERGARDVVLSLDRSGSMAYSNYTYPAWRSTDEVDGTWSGWVEVSSAATYRVPENEEWEVADCADCNATAYGPGENVTLASGDSVRYRYLDADAVFPVPEGKTLLLRDTDGDATNARFSVGGDPARWAAPGDAVDTAEWEYYLPATVGNDPHRKRVDAARDFVDSLVPSKDRAAFVDFDAGGHLEAGLTGDLDALKSSIHGEAWGSTSITAGLETATDELNESGASDHEGVVVLVTDGRNSDLDDSGTNADENEATRDAAVAAKQAGYTVYTVGLGDDADADLLRKVGGNDSTLSGGSNAVTPEFYYAAENADDLSAVLDQIAGDVNQEVRRIDYRNATAAVKVNGSATTLGSSTGLATPGTVVETVTHGVGSYLSFRSTTYECDAWTDEGTVTDPATGETYTQARCTSQSSTGGAYGNRTGTLHEIYTAGDADLDPPAGYDGSWYADGVTEVVERYENRTGTELLANGTFQLDKNEAVFVVGGGGDGNFSVVYYSADDVNDDYYTDGVGPQGMATTSNTFVVDVTGSEVVVCDDGESAAECRAG